MDKVRGWEEKYLSGVMQPSLDSHLHLHITANALVLIHFSEFWMAGSSESTHCDWEPCSGSWDAFPPLLLGWQLKGFGCHTGHDCQGWGVTTCAFCGPVASLERSWVSSDLRRAGSLLGEVCSLSMAGDCTYRPGSTGRCKLHLLHVNSSTTVRYRMFVCFPLANFLTDFFIKTNKQTNNKQPHTQNQWKKYMQWYYSQIILKSGQAEVYGQETHRPRWKIQNHPMATSWRNAAR